MSMMTRFPSPAIAALTGSALANGDLALPRAPVRPYRFGEGEATALADFSGLRAINDRFCRLARGAFLPMLRLQPRMSGGPPELQSFDEWRQAQDQIVSLAVTHVEELRGNLFVVLPHRLVSILTNAYYGGPAIASPPTGTEFSAIERRVIELVTDRVTRALHLAWRDVMPLTLTVAGREENIQFATFADGDEMMVCCRYAVHLPDDEAARIDVLYPLQLLRPVAGQLRSRLQSDSLEEDRSWRERLEQAVMAVPLRLSVRLCQPELPLNRLITLAPGEVVPVTLPGTVDVLVEGRPLFRAQSGEQGGHAAVSILRTAAT